MHYTYQQNKIIILRILLIKTNKKKVPLHSTYAKNKGRSSRGGMTPHFAYANEKFAEEKARDPGVGSRCEHSRRLKILMREFGTLSPEQQQPYCEQAQRARTQQRVRLGEARENEVRQRQSADAEFSYGVGIASKS